MGAILQGLFALSAGFTPALDLPRDVQGERTNVMVADLFFPADLVDTQPVDESPRALTGARLAGFVDDYYYRIHVSPPALDVGNVVSAQTHEVRIWNAYLTPRTLNDLSSENAEGIQIAGQEAPPILFEPLRERTWNIAVGVEGPPVVNAALVWQFTGELPAILRITGNRVTAWPWAPNWRDSVREQLDWLTDILRSQHGVEERRALRDLPVRSYTFSVLAEGADRALLDLAVFSWGARLWALPVWPDVQWLTGIEAGQEEIACDTRHRDFEEGGLALLLGDDATDFEVLEILTLAPDRIGLRAPVARDWRGTVRLYPVRTARLTAQPSLTRLTDTMVRGDIEFRLETPTAWAPGHSLPDYRGWPVLEQRPEESRDLTLAYERLLRELDNGIRVPEVQDTAGLGFPVQGHGWLLDGAEQRADWRSLMHALRGRQGALWIPTWMDDLNLVAAVATASNFIDVAHVQYGRFAAGITGRRDIRLELNDGTIRYRRVIAAADVDAQTERLSLDAPWDIAFEPGQVRRVCWMTLMRLDSDTVELEHITDVEGAARAQLVFRGVRDEL